MTRLTTFIVLFALAYATSQLPAATTLPSESALPEPSVSESGSESDRIRAALDAHQWRRSAAAAALGMSRTTLWRKMREHGLLQ